MSIRIEEISGTLRFEAGEAFEPDDARQIEVAAQLQSRPPILVDLRTARDKHLLALWLVGSIAHQEPGRIRLIGLTQADTRFLSHAGLRHDAR